MKKILALVMTLVFVLLTFTACGSKETLVAKADIKAGIIYLGDKEDSKTLAYMKGIDDMMTALELKDAQVIEKTGVKEDKSCYEAAVDLAKQGCNIVFANSKGYGDYIVQAAGEFPDVQFCQLQGTRAKTSGLKNIHDYFASVFESRYVSGIVAGMKLNEMIDNGEISSEQIKLGYVGTTKSAESVSSYTAFYLGAKSVCANVTMEVQYSGAEASKALETAAGNALIANGCILISQQSHLNGAAASCEANGKYFVGFNTSAIDVAPNFALTSASVNWNSYYKYAVECVANGTAIDTEWCKGYSDSAVGITDINEKAFSTKETVDAVTTAAEKAGTEIAGKKLYVFNTETWTVDNKKITTTVSEELNSIYNGIEYFSKDGYFMECELSSNPMFAFRIDGITELNA